jgi:hypothetical protein
MKQKLKDLGPAALIIAYIFFTAYGLVLMSTPIINLEAYFARGSSLDETFVAKHLNDQVLICKKQWILKNGLKNVGSNQYNAWVSKRLSEEKINFEFELNKALSYRDSNSQIYKDFSIAKKEAIFFIVGQKTNHSLWYLFLKGLIISMISLVLFLFINKDKYLPRGEEVRDDFEKLLFRIIIASFSLAFTCYSIIVFKLILNWSTAPEVGLVFLVAFLLFLLLFLLADVFLSIANGIVEAIIYLLTWTKKVINWLAYNWLRKYSGTTALGDDILNSLNQNGEFFILSNDGAQKTKVIRKIENGIPIFDKKSGEIFSFYNFYKSFVTEPKNNFVKLFHKRVMSKFRNYFSEAGERETVAYVEKLADSIKEKVNKELVIKNAKSTYNESETMLLGLCVKSLRLFRKDLVSASQKKVNDLTTGLRNTLYNEIRRDSIFNFGKKDDFYFKTILPKNTKSFMSLGYLDVFVIEQAPQQRTIRYDGSNYFLAFPYTIFVITFENEVFKSLCFFYSDKSLSSLDDMLYHPSLHNIDGDDCQVCVGINDQLQELKGSLGEKANAVVSAFWQTNFNNDISSCFDYYEDDFADYETWAKMSEDSQFFSGITLSEYGSLRSKIDVIFEDIISESSVKESLKKLRATVDSWFEVNNSNINEQIVKLWTEINVKPFVEKTIDALVVQKNVDQEAIFGLIKRICLECVSDKKNEKDFLTAINKALEKVVKDDFLKLALPIPFEMNPTFPELLNVKND